MNGYFLKPQYARQHDGGNIICGPLQLNWYADGVRLHVTWPVRRTFVIA